MQDLIHIWSGSAGKHWPEAGQMSPHIGLLPDQICLAKTRHSQPELNWIWAGFAQYYSGCLWKNWTKSESGKLIAGRLHPARNWAQSFLHTSLLPDQMCLATPWPDHPDWIQVSFALYDPCLLWKNRTKTDVGSRNWHIQSGLIPATCWP